MPIIIVGKEKSQHRVPGEILFFSCKPNIIRSTLAQKQAMTLLIYYSPDLQFSLFIKLGNNYLQLCNHFLHKLHKA